MLLLLGDGNKKKIGGPEKNTILYFASEQATKSGTAFQRLDELNEVSCAAISPS